MACPDELPVELDGERPERLVLVQGPLHGADDPVQGVQVFRPGPGGGQPDGTHFHDLARLIDVVDSLVREQVGQHLHVQRLRGG